MVLVVERQPLEEPKPRIHTVIGGPPRLRQACKREGYGITSHTPFMCIAILAGLQVPGWPDGRVEFEDGCSLRTAVPLIWTTGRNDLLNGDVLP